MITHVLYFHFTRTRQPKIFTLEGPYNVLIVPIVLITYLVDLSLNVSTQRYVHERLFR